MNLLDENIIENQREILRRSGIAIRQVGYEVAHPGIKDHDIIPLLHSLRRTTFFTRDVNFYKRSLRHNNYYLVFLKQYLRQNGATEHQPAELVSRDDKCSEPN
jgi:hypothetical protein